MYQTNATTPSVAAVWRGSSPHRPEAQRGHPPATPFVLPGTSRPRSPPVPRTGVSGAAGAPPAPPRWVRAPTQPHGLFSPAPAGRRGQARWGRDRRAPLGQVTWGWDESPGAGASPPEPGQGGGQRFPPSPWRSGARGTPSLGQTPGAPAAPSDLLRAAKISSPAAERGEPRASPLSSGCCCFSYCRRRRRSASLRFPTDGLAGRRLTPRSARAPSLSPAGDFSPRFLYWRQGT